MMDLTSHPFRRGEVWFVRYHDYDQHGKLVEFQKPHVVLQDAREFGNLFTVQGVRLTTKKVERIYPGEVWVSPKECGASSRAKVLCHSGVRPLHKMHFIKYLYSLTPQKMREIDREIRSSHQMGA